MGLEIIEEDGLMQAAIASLKKSNRSKLKQAYDRNQPDKLSVYLAY